MKALKNSDVVSTFKFIRSRGSLAHDKLWHVTVVPGFESNYRTNSAYTHIKSAVSDVFDLAVDMATDGDSTMPRVWSDPQKQFLSRVTFTQLVLR